MANENIQIVGYNNKLIKAILVKNQIANQMLAVIFPGYAYSVQGPILYFSTMLFENMGYDILTVEYKYNEDNEFVSADDDSQDKWFNYDILDIIAQTGNFDRAKYIWVTPDNSFEEVVN